MDGDADDWLDEDVNDAVVAQRNTAQEWNHLSAKFSDVGSFYDID